MRGFWFRNKRGKYHAARFDYMRSGRSECGAWILRPAFVATEDGGYSPLWEVPFAKRCKHCRKLLDAAPRRNDWTKIVCHNTLGGR